MSWFRILGSQNRTLKLVSLRCRAGTHRFRFGHEVEVRASENSSIDFRRDLESTFDIHEALPSEFADVHCGAARHVRPPFSPSLLFHAAGVYLFDIPLAFDPGP